MGNIDISGLDKAELLAALHFFARPMGSLAAIFPTSPISVEEAKRLIKQRSEIVRFVHDESPVSLNFDYINQRAMHVNITGDTMPTGGYNADNGEGQAERVVKVLRALGYEEMFVKVLLYGEVLEKLAQPEPPTLSEMHAILPKSVEERQKFWLEFTAFCAERAKKT